jgi:predicted transcriptional regulator
MTIEEIRKYCKDNNITCTELGNNTTMNESTAYRFLFGKTNKLYSKTYKTLIKYLEEKMGNELARNTK